MPKIKRFGNPDFLRNIQPENLLNLLRCFDEFFARQGISLKGKKLTAERLDQLSALFVSPPSTCPGKLLDAIEMLEMLTSSAGLDELRMVAGELVRRVHQRGDSAGDIAVKVWLMDSKHIERIYTKFSIDLGRTMKCYRPDILQTPAKPDRDACRAMEAEVSLCCATFFDTTHCEVMAFPETDGYALLIRHGEHVKRFGVIDDDNKVDTKALRPLKHDVGFIDARTGEVLLSGRNDEIRNMYRHVVSQVLFGNPERLRPAKRFTLEPLREGRESLICPELEGVEYSKLRELHLLRRNTSRRLILSADDVFDEIEEHGNGFLRSFMLQKARFTIHVRGERRAPSIFVVPGDDIIRGDIHHPIARPWLDACRINNLTEDAQVLARN